MPAPAKQLTAADPTVDTVAAEITRLGFKYRIVPQYDLTLLSEDQRVQVRELRSYAPKDMVERFAVQMDKSAFPPIVVTEDHWLVDGNTRVGACARRRALFHPAIVVDVRWGTASTKQQNELFALAATLNSQGGKQLTDKERKTIASHFLALGWKKDEIARAIGVLPSKLAGIERALKAETRLRTVGMDPEAVGRKLNVLGDNVALSLNHEPYRRVATLTQKADLSAADVKSLVRRVKDTGSDKDALSLLDQVEAENASRIAQRSLTGRGKPPASAILRQHLGVVNKYEGQEAELVERNPDVVPAYTEALRRAISVLTRTLDLQGS